LLVSYSFSSRSAALWLNLFASYCFYQRAVACVYACRSVCNMLKGLRTPTYRSSGNSNFRNPIRANDHSSLFDAVQVSFLLRVMNMGVFCEAELTLLLLFWKRRIPYLINPRELRSSSVFRTTSLAVPENPCNSYPNLGEADPGGLPPKKPWRQLFVVSNKGSNIKLN
jgi:hypothetical protein